MKKLILKVNNGELDMEYKEIAKADEIPIHKARFYLITGKKLADPRFPIPKAFKMGR